MHVSCQSCLIEIWKGCLIHCTLSFIDEQTPQWKTNIPVNFMTLEMKARNSRGDKNHSLVIDSDEQSAIHQKPIAVNWI